MRLIPFTPLGPTTSEAVSGVARRFNLDGPYAPAITGGTVASYTGSSLRSNRARVEIDDRFRRITGRLMATQRHSTFMQRRAKFLVLQQMKPQLLHRGKQAYITQTEQSWAWHFMPSALCFWQPC